MIVNPQFVYCADCASASATGSYEHLQPIGLAVTIPPGTEHGESAYFRLYQCPACGHVWQLVVDLHAGGTKTFRPITTPEPSLEHLTGPD